MHNFAVWQGDSEPIDGVVGDFGRRHIEEAESFSEAGKHHEGGITELLTAADVERSQAGQTRGDPPGTVVGHLTSGNAEPAQCSSWMPADVDDVRVGERHAVRFQFF